jgi:hypothetical protein
MADLLHLFVKSTDLSLPPEERKLAGQQLEDYFRNLFYSVEVARFLKGPGGSLPPPEPPDSIPDSVREQLANHEFLIRELLLHALGDPSPQPSLLTVLSEKKLRYVTAKELLALFERAADEMRQIVEILDDQKTND